MKHIYYNPEHNGRRCVENAGNGLRFVGYVDDILTNIRHTGWFVDNFQEETARGVVYQLPARNGAKQYIAGYQLPCDDTCVCLSFDITDDKTTAAMWADSMTELMAEEEREYDAKFQAEQQIEQACDEIADARETHSMTIVALSDAKANPVLESAARSVINQARQSVHTAIERIRLLRDEPWQSVI